MKTTVVADRLAEALGVANDLIRNDTDIIDSTQIMSAEEEAALARVDESEGQLVPMSIDETMDANLIEDYRSVRSTLQNLVQKGEAALNGIILVANGSDHPRAYEVAGTLIKTISEVSRELLEIQRTIREMQAIKSKKVGGESKVAVGEGGVVNQYNQTLVIDSDSLSDMLLEMKKNGKLDMPVAK